MEKAKSPWQRHNKVKFQYSPAYQTWRNNPTPYTAQKHREFIEREFGPLAKVRPARNFQEVLEDFEDFAEAAE